MLALDVARIEAGLLLIDVDFNGSKKALIDVAEVHAVRDGARPAGRTSTRARFVGQAALRRRSEARGPAREIVGLEIDWPAVEALYEKLGPRAADPGRGLARRRAGLPRRPPGRQGDVDDVVADAEEDDRARDGRGAASNAIGTTLEIEVTVEAVRHRVPATVVKTPFFNPPRKTATPIR